MTDPGTIDVQASAHRAHDYVEVTLALHIPEGAHIEAHEPLDPLLIPTVVDFGNLEVRSVHYPEPVEKDLGFPGQPLRAPTGCPVPPQARRSRCRSLGWEAAAMSHPRPACVLVAEDESDLRLLLRAQLELDGYHVIETADGAEVLAHCRSSSVDLVLLDLNMPVVDGFAVLQRLRTEPELAIPVIVVTASDTPADVVTTLELGAIDHIAKPFDEQELLARVAAGVRTKRAQDELRHQNAALETASRTDHLTGLFNRRHLEEELRHATAVARRHRQSLAVALFDIDYFKRINDECGHAAGDAALREIARRLAASVRAGNVAGRWGGEEFLVILPTTSASQSRRFAERVRKAVEATPVSVDGPAVPITVSAGCAASRQPLPTIVQRADSALFRAKQAGRNRVAVDTEATAQLAEAVLPGGHRHDAPGS